MRVHQVIVGARDGDAITSIAQQIEGVLLERWDSKIFGVHVEPTMARSVQGIAKLSAQSSEEDVLIVHLSFGDELFEEAVRQFPGRLIGFFHNITPPEFYREFQPEFADRLDSGLRFCTEIAERMEWVLCPSDFNAQALELMGIRNYRRTEFVIDVSWLENSSGDLGFLQSLNLPESHRVLLCVGQALPHKRFDLAIAALHFAMATSDPDLTLVIVGHQPLEQHQRALERLARSFGLSDRVRFLGPVSNDQLAELFRRADMLLVTSSHEGFCVPVLEAFASGTPVLSVRTGALPETVGNGGLLVEQSVASIAEGIALLADPLVAAAVVSAGRLRASEMQPEAARIKLRGLLGELIDGPLISAQS